MEGNFKPSIGKNVIETLTVGMYDAPYFIYREYVQNAADAIDLAVSSKVFSERSEGKIEITINNDSRRITIEDNATGIEAKNVPALLGNIAQSTKNQYVDKGFRGIGRLGGLGYCNTLTYETSFSGEKVKSVMMWDAKNLRAILNDPNAKIDAAQLISVITNFSRHEEKENKHYFKVTLEGVTSDELLDEEAVRKYLSMVAPVPFDPKFSFREQIYKQAEINRVEIDEYKIFILGKPLFKGYKDQIFDGGEEVDKVVDVEFFKEFHNKELLYWGWYGITKNMNYIPVENNEKFIRLRKANIQIGLESRLDKFHKKESGNRYFIGEVYAVHKELRPNGRRDFFVGNEVLTDLITKLTEFFKTLHDLFYDFSKKNSAFKLIDQSKESERVLKEKIKQKSSAQEIENLSREVEDKGKKSDQAKQRLAVLYDKYKGRTLARVITEKVSKTELEKHNPTKIKSPKSPEISNNGKLLKAERNLLNFIYKIIRSAQSKSVSEKLISRIESELKDEYLSKRNQIIS